MIYKEEYMHKLAAVLDFAKDEKSHKETAKTLRLRRTGLTPEEAGVHI